MPAAFAPEYVHRPLVGGDSGGAQFAPDYVQQPLVGGEQDSEAVKGLRRGVNSLGTGVQAAAGQFVQPFNEQLGTGIIEDAYLANQQVAQNNPARVATWDQVHNGSDFVDYGIGKVAEAAPYFPLAYTGGLAARAIGMSPLAGGAATFAPPMMGDEAMQLQHDPAAAGMSPLQKAMYAGGVGLARGTAEGAMGAYMGGSLLRPSARSLTSTLVTRPALNTVGEGMSEAGGDVISQGAKNIYNPNAVYDPAQTKEAFIGGMAAGAPFSAAHAIPDTLLSSGATGAKAAQPLAEAGLKAGKDAAEYAQEQWEAAHAALPPELKQAVAEGGMRLDEAVAWVEKNAPQAMATAGAKAGEIVNDVEALGAEIGEAAKAGANGFTNALKERYAPEQNAGATQALVEAVTAATGVAPKTDKPFAIVRGAVQDFFGLNKAGADSVNTLKQRLNNNVQARQSVAGMVDVLMKQSNVPADSDLGKLHALIKSDQPIDMAQAARYKVLATEEIALSARLDALERLVDYQLSSGENVPNAKAQFSRTPDVANKSVREVFSSEQMRGALAQMGITKEAVNAIVRGVSGEIQAKKLTERGLTRLADETADKYLRKLGLHNRADLKGTIVDGITAALQPHVDKMPEHMRGGSDLPDAFVSTVNAAVTNMLTAKGRKDFSATPEDAKRATDAIVHFITKLAKGETAEKTGVSYSSRAQEFANGLVKMWGESAYPALQHIVDASNALLPLDSGAQMRIQRLVEATGTVQRVSAAIGPHLEKGANASGVIRTSERLIDQVRMVEKIASRASSPDEHVLAFNTAYEALVQQWMKDGILKGKSDAQRRDAAKAVYEGVLSLYAGEKAASRGGQGEEHARTNVEEFGDLDNPEFKQDDAMSALTKDDATYVPEWKGKDENPALGTDDVKDSEISYAGTGMYDTSKRGVSQKSVDLGAPLTNMKSADFPWGMTRDEQKGVQHLVHAESGHRVAAGKEVGVAEWAKDMSTQHKTRDIESFKRQAMQSLLEFDKVREGNLQDILDSKHSTQEQKAKAEDDLSWIRQRRDLAENLRNVKNPGDMFFPDDKYAEPLTAQYHYYRTQQEGGENLRLGPEELKMFSLRTDDKGKPTETREQFIERLKLKEQGSFKGTQNAKIHENSLMTVKTEDGDILVDIAALVANVIRKHQKGDVSGGDKSGVDMSGIGRANAEHSKLEGSKDAYAALHEIMAAIEDATGIKQTDKLHTYNTGGMKNRVEKSFYDKDLIILRDKTNPEQGRGIRYGDYSANARMENGKYVSDTLGRDASGKAAQVNPGALITTKTPANTLMPSKIHKGIAASTGEGMASRIDGTKEVFTNLNVRELLIRMLERNGLDSSDLLSSQKHLPVTLVADLLHGGITELRDQYGVNVDTSSQKYDNLVLAMKKYGEESHPLTWKQVRNEINTLEGKVRNGEGKPSVPRDVDAVTRQEAKVLEQKLETALAATRLRKERGEGSMLDLPERVEGNKAKLERAALEQMDFDPADASNKMLAEVMQQIKDSSPTGRAEDAPLFDYSRSGGESRAQAVARITEQIARSAFSPTELAGLDLGKMYAGGFDKVLAKFDASVHEGGFDTSPTSNPVGAPLVLSKHSPTPPRPKELPLSSAEPEPKPVRISEAPLVGKEPKTRAQLKAADIAAAEALREAREARAAERSAARRAPEDITNPMDEFKPPARAEVPETDMAALAKTLAGESYNGEAHPKLMSTLDATQKAQLADALRDIGDNLNGNSAGAKLLKVLGTKAPEGFTKPTQSAKLPNGTTVTKEVAQMARSQKDFLETFDDYSETQVNDYIKQVAPEFRAKLIDKIEALDSLSSEVISGLRTKLTDTAFSRTPPSDRIFYDGKVPHELVEQAFQAHVDKFVKGLTVRVAKEGLVDEAGVGVSGMAKLSGAVKELLVSAWAPDGLRTLDHETWHGVENALKNMGKEGEYIVAQLHKASTNGMLDAMLKKEYANDPDALKQLSDPAERMARMWEVFNKKEGKLPIPEEARNWLQKIKDFLMDMIGMTSGEKQTENFFKYIADSGLVRDIENPYAVLRELGETKTDKFISNTREAIKPLNKMLDTVMMSGAERVRVHKDKYLDQIVDAYGGKLGKGGFHTKHVAQLNIFGGMTERIVKAVPNEEALNSLKTFEPVHDALQTYMDGTLGKGAFNRLVEHVVSYNRDKVSDHMEEFLSDLLRHGGIEAMEGRDRAGVAKNIATKIAERGYFYDPNVQIFKDSPAMQAKWMEKSLERQTYDMILQGVKMVERHKAFGEKTADAPMGVRMKELLDKAEANGASKEALDDARNYMNSFDGKHDFTLSPDMKKIVGGILFAENVMRLPLALTSQLIEPFQLAMRKNDLPSVLKSTWRGIKDFPRMFEAINDSKVYGKDYWEHFSELAGSARSRAIGESIAQLSNGIASRGLTGKLNEMFFRYNGMDGWDRSMHISATEHAVEFLQDHANGMDAKHSARFLKELGVTAEEVKAAMTTEMYEGSAYKTLDIEARDKTGELVHKKVRDAINQYVDEALAHPDAGSNPFWMNDPRFALLAQMKRFSFAFSTFVNDRNMREMEQGNFGVTPAMVAAVPWALLFVAPVKHIVKGTDMHEMGFIDSLMRGIELSGQTGKQQFGIDAMRQAQFGGSAVEALLGPTASTLGDTLRTLAQAKASLGT